MAWPHSTSAWHRGLDGRRYFAPTAPHGVGLGLRWDFLDDVLASPVRPPLPFFEVSPENYMRRGGYFPAALGQVRADFALLSHGLMMNLGSTDPLDATYLRQLRGFLHEVGARYHTDHLCWTGVNGQTLHDLLPLPLTRASLTHVVDQIRRAQDALGLPMGVENISYYTGIHAPPGLDEADFVAEVIERADCGLLLDLNNVQVNADNHGFAARDYLARLPLDRVMHLHVAGGERRPHLDNLIIDTHGADVDERVALAMAFVVRQIGPVAVVYERDHNIPSWPQLLTQVQALQRAYDDALAAFEQTREHPYLNDRGMLDVGSVSAGSVDVGAQHAHPWPLSEEHTLTQTLNHLSRAILASDDGDVWASTVLHDTLTCARPRWPIYRRLIRQAIASTLEDFLPKTRQVASTGWTHDFENWLDRVGPQSKYLRDLPLEFAEESYVADERSLLHDLARYELSHYAVSALAADAQAVATKELTLEGGVPFHPALVRLDLEHAVHEWDERSPSPLSSPERRSCHLLVYRAADFNVRALELSRAAATLVDHLRAGNNLRDAVLQSALTEQAITAKETIDDQLLARLSGVLADFVERGIILHSEEAPPS